MLAVFVIGYIGITMEHRLKIDKASIALLMSGVLWVIYITLIPMSTLQTNGESFNEFIAHNPQISSLSPIEQCRRFIVDFQLVEYLGDISSTLFFLIGAMTIVELIDAHNGFEFITEKITSRDKKRLLWIISGISFMMSAVLDNLTTSIVMIMLVKKLVPNYKERWVFASMIIISANSGGAWSPIGDVTTIMLWIKGKISSWPLMSSLFIPSLVSTLVPLYFAGKMLKGTINNHTVNSIKSQEVPLDKKKRLEILVLGIISLLSVPVFKYLTGLPPFIGVLTSLSMIWIFTEIIYSKVDVKESVKRRVTNVIKRVDTATILFFLGILMSVMALKATGLLNMLGEELNKLTQNVYIIDITIGIMSSIVDNVPLVAVAMGMYPVAGDAQFLQHFVMDGTFWQFLAYCSGVGGSILIIGSAAGVVVMGLEKISFNWYFKNISILALAGYLAGAATYIILKTL